MSEKIIKEICEEAFVTYTEASVILKFITDYLIEYSLAITPEAIEKALEVFQDMSLSALSLIQAEESGANFTKAIGEEVHKILQSK